MFEVKEGETKWCKETAPSTDMTTQHKIISHCKNNQAHEDDSTSTSNRGVSATQQTADRPLGQFPA